MDEHGIGRLVACPECGRLAEVVDEFAVSSTDGPVAHVKVRCVERHWFLLPADRCPSLEAADPRVVAGRRRGC